MDDSKPAFARPVSRPSPAGPVSGSQGGMTLREWYAGLAMQGAMAHENSAINTPEEVAASAVRVADALLAALEAES